jgi:nucleoside-diphosphate-sugar epimerase
MRILVTGAAGFIGGHLIGRLRRGHEVFALGKRVPPVGGHGGVSWVEQDLTESLDYARLPRGVDVVVHLAQSRFYKDFPEQAGDIFAVNVDGTFKLLEYARRAGAGRFILASTGGVYGYSYEKFVETDPVSPLNFYLSSKYISELLVGNYQQYFDTTVLRLFFVYGAGQKPTMLIPRLVRSVLAGEPVTLRGREGIHINPVHVGDVVSALEGALGLRGHHLINVAGPQVLSLREICRVIGQHVGREPVFTALDDQKSGYLIGDITKMEELLGGSGVPFREGVLELCREAVGPAG